MRLKCDVPGCENRSRSIGILKYLWAAWRSRSFSPFTCPDHYDIFAPLVERSRPFAAEEKLLDVLGKKYWADFEDRAMNGFQETEEQETEGENNEVPLQKG